MATPSQARVARRRKMPPIIVVAILSAAIALSVGPKAGNHFPSIEDRVERITGTISAARDVLIASIGEDPHLDPDYVTDLLPLCEPVSRPRSEALAEGIALMRATDEGLKLYNLIVEEGVCIRIEDLDFNSAYATSRWTPDRGWSESQIVLSRDHVDSLYPDVLAAILVHEATHIARAVGQTACYYADACTILGNGVELEEEMAAHAAEAEWWIAAYGRDGKDFAFGPDAAENRLKAAYLQGPGAFRQFIREARSDPREGEGISHIEEEG
jgi:hypothetical protein